MHIFLLRGEIYYSICYRSLSNPYFNLISCNCIIWDLIKFVSDYLRQSSLITCCVPLLVSAFCIISARKTTSTFTHYLIEYLNSINYFSSTKINMYVSVIPNDIFKDLIVLDNLYERLSGTKEAYCTVTEIVETTLFCKKKLITVL